MKSPALSVDIAFGSFQRRPVDVAWEVRIGRNLSNPGGRTEVKVWR